MQAPLRGHASTSTYTAPSGWDGSGRARGVRTLLLCTTLFLMGCDALATAPQIEPLEYKAAHAWAQEAAALIDQHRAALGCGSLTWHGKSATVATAYAQQMSQEAFFGHVDLQGRDLKDRLNQAGIAGYREAAETIAAGQDTAGKVVSDWIKSPEHRAILEECRYTHLGLGFHEGTGPYREYWTAVFIEAP